MLLCPVVFGVAAGGRTFAPLVALVLTRPVPTPARAAGLLFGGGELVADTLTKTPSRTEPPGLVARALTSGMGAGVLAGPARCGCRGRLVVGAGAGCRARLMAGTCGPTRQRQGQG